MDGLWIDWRQHIHQLIPNNVEDIPSPGDRDPGDQYQSGTAWGGSRQYQVIEGVVWKTGFFFINILDCTDVKNMWPHMLKQTVVLCTTFFFGKEEEEEESYAYSAQRGSLIAYVAKEK